MPGPGHAREGRGGSRNQSCLGLPLRQRPFIRRFVSSLHCLLFYFHSPAPWPSKTHEAAALSTVVDTEAAALSTVVDTEAAALNTVVDTVVGIVVDTEAGEVNGSLSAAPSLFHHPQTKTVGRLLASLGNLSEPRRLSRRTTRMERHTCCSFRSS